MTQALTNSQLSDQGANAIRKAFKTYRTRFKEITERAQSRFLDRDWQAMRTDAAQRLELYRDAVDRIETAVGRDLADGLEVSLAKYRLFAETSEALPGAFDGARIGIDPQQPPIGFGGLQDPNGVPSAANGRIDLEAARVRRESQDDLLKHHRQVPYFLFHQRSDRPDGPPGPWRLIWF